MTPILRSLHWLLVEFIQSSCTGVQIPSHWSPLISWPLLILIYVFFSNNARSSGVVGLIDYLYDLLLTFFPSIYWSKKHFKHSFANLAPTIWSNTPDVIRSATFLTYTRSKLKSYFFSKNSSSLFPLCVSVTADLFIFPNILFRTLAYGKVVTEIKCYKILNSVLLASFF